MLITKVLRFSLFDAERVRARIADATSVSSNDNKSKRSCTDERPTIYLNRCLVYSSARNMLYIGGRTSYR